MGMDRAQKRAVAHGAGPCQVLAGPGSGKTLTIVNRIKYLIEEKQVRPEEILVITFTRFAAKEMRSRLSGLMGKRAAAVTVGTFHGIYYGILRWAYRFGPQNILSEEEKYQLLRSAAAGKEIPVEDEEDFFRAIAEDIGKIKNSRMDVEKFAPSGCGREVFREIYREYEEKRKAARKIDFDDMLTVCYNLLESRPDVLALWQRKFKYILIDEFQDINRIQYDVIRMLALPEDNLFVVGDDDQAIYGFRGADAGLMFRFREDYPGAEQILLGTNYRSTGNIVKNSLKVIRHNEKRFSKELNAGRKDGACLHVQETADTSEEARYVTEEIIRLADSGIPLEETAVLFRTHTDARPLTEELVKRRIPYQMKEHLPNLYDHFIARDIRAYFRLAMGREDRRDFLRVMNRPKRYLGRDCLTEGEPFFEAARTFYCDKNWMLDRIDQFEWDLKMLSCMAPYAAVQYIRKRIGYDDFLKDYAYIHKLELSVLREVAAEITEAAKPFSSIEEWFGHVEEYSEALRKKEREKGEDEKGVRLMTLHGSKGLEFHTVYLVGANEGNMPYKRAESEQETEEERRLFYVGMTRAKEMLRICYVRTKNGKEVSPSRFVEELLEDI
ncbi:ATP-dependent helicase [Clostridium sp. Marseille-P3244]|uniref:ATP-dependent helicase n=1 Tax=Clostridium sp. Marseille-P3244 TaxID=1871020 RepID=UPI0009312FFC|nr:ATP-dependent helicase [Clostridium sp. Marseille-P3244]